jgi:hypothetical protein
MKIGTALLVIWLLVGVAAANQRNYFSGSTRAARSSGQSR